MIDDSSPHTLSFIYPHSHTVVPLRLLVIFIYLLSHVDVYGDEKRGSDDSIEGKVRA